MEPILEPHQPSDASELQEVLTRYVDSRDGYRQASELVDEPGLASALKSISERRGEIVGRMASMISEEGQRPDVDGSTEAGVHRWWIRLRDKISKHKVETVLSECLRGEKELIRTLTGILEQGHVHDEHQLIFRQALSEIDLAIRAFETALGEH